MSEAELISENSMPQRMDGIENAYGLRVHDYLQAVEQVFP